MMLGQKNNRSKTIELKKVESIRFRSKKIGSKNISKVKKYFEHGIFGPKNMGLEKCCVQKKWSEKSRSRKNLN